jgi:hypothetical protein
MNNSGRFLDDAKDREENDGGDEEADQHERGASGQHRRGSFFRRRQRWDRPEIIFFASHSNEMGSTVQITTAHVVRMLTSCK